MPVRGLARVRGGCGGANAAGMAGIMGMQGACKLRPACLPVPGADSRGCDSVHDSWKGSDLSCGRSLAASLATSVTTAAPRVMYRWDVSQAGSAMTRGCPPAHPSYSASTLCVADLLGRVMSCRSRKGPHWH